MKHKLWKVFLSFILAVLASATLALPAFALPQDPTPRVVEQSCGTPLTVRFLGDEFLTWTETLSGDVIAYSRDTNNWYYAYVSDGHIYPGDEKVRLITPLFGDSPQTITADDMCEVFEVASYYRAQFESTLRPINLTNNRIPLLVMLIEFSDRELSDVYLTTDFPTHTSFFSNEFFGTEGKTVNTYFAEVSHDFDLQFIEPDFTVANGFRVENPTPDVALLEVRDGVVRVRVNAPHPNPEDPRGNPAIALNPSVRAAFNALRNYLDLSNVNCSPATAWRRAGYITSNDFVISTVIAGYEFTASSNQEPRINGHMNSGSGTIRPDGDIGAYSAIGELSARTMQGVTHYSAMGIGGAIHEIGHLFGLPDLYGHFPVHAALGRFVSDGVN